MSDVAMITMRATFALGFTLTLQLAAMPPAFAQVALKPLGHTQVLLFTLQVALLLFVSYMCGEVMVRLRQPAAVGNLLGGILLGPSVLGSLCPPLQHLIFPAEQVQSYMLEVLCWLGVLFLVMLAGTHVDFHLIEKDRKAITLIGIAGSIIPFLCGAAFTYALPETLIDTGQNRTLTALFLGTFFTLSSVPVIARILCEMRLEKERSGQLILTAAVVHDGLGYVLLGVISAAAAHQYFVTALVTAAIGTFGFIAVLYFGREIIFAGFRRAEARSLTSEPLLALLAVFVLALAAITQLLGAHAILGAFAAGVLLTQVPRLRERALPPLEQFTTGVFAPIFFATAGLNIQLTAFARIDLLMASIGMSLAAAAAKIGSCYLGGRLGGLPGREALTVGIGANAFGAVGIVAAIVGFSVGIINSGLFSVIVAMSVISTMITPALLGIVAGKIPDKIPLTDTN
jgi:Kef-type K+ transport system membrane component KefB